MRRGGGGGGSLACRRIFKYVVLLNGWIVEFLELGRLIDEGCLMA